jgi:hypothetical protein
MARAERKERSEIGSGVKRAKRKKVIYVLEIQSAMLGLD